MKMTKLGLGFLVGSLALGLTGAGLVTGGLVKTFVKPEASSTSSAPTKKIQSIYVSTNPTRMVYIIGQSFDKTGMVVEALYEDETTSEIEDYTIGSASTFQEEGKSIAVDISYTDSDGTLLTTNLAVRVVASLDGVGEAVGLSTVNGPIIQREGQKFDWTDLSFNVLYDLDGYIGKGEKVYTKGQNIDGNGYNTLKLVKDDVLTKDTVSVDFSYSQGKSASIPVAVASSILASCTKVDYAAGTDKLAYSTIALSPTIVNGASSLPALKVADLRWTDDREGEISDGYIFSTSGTHSISASYGAVWDNISFSVTVSGGSGVLVNQDDYKSECEKTTIVGASALVQTGSNYASQYTDDGCDYGAFHAAAYLGYSGKYACQGSPYGGFVHNFDVGRDASMTFSFTAPAGGYADLWVRGASNDASPANFTANDLKVTTAAKFSLNGSDIASSLDETVVFPGIKNATGTPDAQNRTGEVNGISLSGRYVYLNWADLKLGKIALRKGKNTLVITPNNDYKSGHWDALKIDCAPYKA